MSELDRRLTDAEFREAVLYCCLKKGEFGAAGNNRTNNKLAVEELQHIPHLRRETVKRVGALVMKHDPDFVVGVPNDAHWLASDIALEHDLYQVELRVVGHNDQQAMDYQNRFIDHDVSLPGLQRGVLVGGVFDRFAHTRLALAVPDLGNKIVAVAGVFDRGDAAGRQPLTTEHEAVITEPIPPQIPVQAELWLYAESV